MSEIKENEYIRTNNGSIQKVLEIQPYYENDTNMSEYDYISTEIFKQWKRYQLEDIVKKHSPNIIDLIEVGDYVNGSRVIANEKGVVWTIEDDFELEHIKTIVTKEQFKGSEYIV